MAPRNATTTAPAPGARGASSSATSSASSQTLDRGIRVLEIVTDAHRPPSIAEIAAELGVHRSIVYRILRTLEDHGLVRRDAAGRVHGAPGLAVLARRVEQDLQAAALPELSAISADLGMSAFVAVWDGQDCTTLVTVEPPRGNLVTQRPGTRHPLGRGAPGLAIAADLGADELAAAAEAGLVEGPERPEVAVAREAGHAVSRNEVIAGVSSVAVSLRVRGQLPAALAVVYATRHEDTDAIAGRLAAGAEAIAAALGEELLGRQ